MMATTPARFERCLQCSAEATPRGGTNSNSGSNGSGSGGSGEREAGKVRLKTLVDCLHTFCADCINRHMRESTPTARTADDVDHDNAEEGPVFRCPRCEATFQRGSVLDSVNVRVLAQRLSSIGPQSIDGDNNASPPSAKTTMNGVDRVRNRRISFDVDDEDEYASLNGDPSAIINSGNEIGVESENDDDEGSIYTCEICDCEMELCDEQSTSTSLSTFATPSSDYASIFCVECCFSMCRDCVRRHRAGRYSGGHSLRPLTRALIGEITVQLNQTEKDCEEQMLCEQCVCRLVSCLCEDCNKYLCVPCCENRILSTNAGQASSPVDHTDHNVFTTGDWSPSGLRDLSKRCHSAMQEFGDEVKQFSDMSSLIQPAPLANGNASKMHLALPPQSVSSISQQRKCLEQATASIIADIEHRKQHLIARLDVLEASQSCFRAFEKDLKLIDDDLALIKRNERKGLYTEQVVQSSETLATRLQTWRDLRRIKLEIEALAKKHAENEQYQASTTAVTNGSVREGDLRLNIRQTENQPTNQLSLMVTIQKMSLELRQQGVSPVEMMLLPDSMNSIILSALNSAGATNGQLSPADKAKNDESDEEFDKLSDTSPYEFPKHNFSPLDDDGATSDRTITKAFTDGVSDYDSFPRPPSGIAHDMASRVLTESRGCSPAFTDFTFPQPPKTAVDCATNTMTTPTAIATSQTTEKTIADCSTQTFSVATTDSSCDAMPQPVMMSTEVQTIITGTKMETVATQTNSDMSRTFMVNVGQQAKFMTSFNRVDDSGVEGLTTPRSVASAGSPSSGHSIPKDDDIADNRRPVTTRHDDSDSQDVLGDPSPKSADDVDQEKPSSHDIMDTPPHCQDEFPLRSPQISITPDDDHVLLGDKPLSSNGSLRQPVPFSPAILQVTTEEDNTTPPAVSNQPSSWRGSTKRENKEESNPRHKSTVYHRLTPKTDDLQPPTFNMDDDGRSGATPSSAQNGSNTFQRQKHERQPRKQRTNTVDSNNSVKSISSGRTSAGGHSTHSKKQRAPIPPALADSTVSTPISSGAASTQTIDRKLIGPGSADVNTSSLQHRHRGKHRARHTNQSTLPPTPGRHASNAGNNINMPAAMTPPEPFIASPTTSPGDRKPSSSRLPPSPIRSTQSFKQPSPSSNNTTAKSAANVAQREWRKEFAQLDKTRYVQPLKSTGETLFESNKAGNLSKNKSKSMGRLGPYTSDRPDNHSSGFGEQWHSQSNLTDAQYDIQDENAPGKPRRKSKSTKTTLQPTKTDYSTWKNHNDDDQVTATIHIDATKSPRRRSKDKPSTLTSTKAHDMYKSTGDIDKVGRSTVDAKKPSKPSENASSLARYSKSTIALNTNAHDRSSAKASAGTTMAQFEATRRAPAPHEGEYVQAPVDVLPDRGRDDRLRLYDNRPSLSSNHQYPHPYGSHAHDVDDPEPTQHIESKFELASTQKTAKKGTLVKKFSKFFGGKNSSGK